MVLLEVIQVGGKELVGRSVFTVHITQIVSEALSYSSMLMASASRSHKTCILSSCIGEVILSARLPIQVINFRTCTKLRYSTSSL